MSGFRPSRSPIRLGVPPLGGEKSQIILRLDDPLLARSGIFAIWFQLQGRRIDVLEQTFSQENHRAGVPYGNPALN
jgi:hypothetical protein